MQGMSREEIKKIIKEALEEYFRAANKPGAPNTGLNGMSYKTDAVGKQYTPKQSTNDKEPH